MTRSRFKTATGQNTWHPSGVARYLKRLGVFEDNHPKRDAATVFAQRVDKSGPTDCHLWTGTLDDDGYGLFRGKAAHRFAFEQFSKAPLGKQQVHHTCTTRRCVNPHHLTPTADRAAHARLHKLEREFIEYASSEAGLAELLGYQGDAVLAACV